MSASTGSISDTAPDSGAGAQETEPTRGAPDDASTSDPRVRLPTLDGLRGLAVILVLLVHFFSGRHHVFALDVMMQFATMGWIGVDLFFVLSGFLITRILVASKGAPRYFRDFYSRRALRIFPLYYGVLFFVLVVGPLITGSAPEGPSELWLWLYGTNVYPVWYGEWFEFPNALDLELRHFWSLAVEEHFYLIWPLLVWAFDTSRLARICLGFIVFSFAYRSFWVSQGVDYGVIYCQTLSRVDTLALGSLIALVSSGGAKLAFLARPARWTMGLSAVVLVIGSVVVGSTNWTNGFTLTIGITLVGVFFGGFLVVALLAAPESLLGRVLCSRVLRFFGLYSYGIYVFNGLLRLALERGPLSPEAIRRVVPSHALSQLIYLVIASLISIALAMLSWHLFEKHFLKLKRYFEYRPPAEAELKAASEAGALEPKAS